MTQNLEQLTTQKNDIENSDRPPLSEVTLKNLEEIVKLPASDDLIWKIVTKTQKKLEKDKIPQTWELTDVIYRQNSLDPETMGIINESDRINFFNEIKKDYLENKGGLPQNPLTRQQPGYYTFQSWDILGGEKLHNNESGHRFYINPKAEDTMEFCNILYDKCKEKGIPFYFKTHKDEAGKGRKDGVVIYTSTEYLEQNLKLLQEIEEEHPDLVNKIGEPPEIVGKVSNWLGYASDKPGAEKSYSDIIFTAVEQGLYKSVENWVTDHQNLYFKENSDSPSIPITDYYNKLITFGEKVTRTLRLTQGIPKEDRQFIRQVCTTIRNEMSSMGIDTENICYDKTRKTEVDSYIRQKGKPSPS